MRRVVALKRGRVHVIAIGLDGVPRSISSGTMPESYWEDPVWDMSDVIKDSLVVLDRRVVWVGNCMTARAISHKSQTPTAVLRVCSLTFRTQQGLDRYRGRALPELLRMPEAEMGGGFDSFLLEWLTHVCLDLAVAGGGTRRPGTSWS